MAGARGGSGGCRGLLHPRTCCGASGGHRVGGKGRAVASAPDACGHPGRAATGRKSCCWPLRFSPRFLVTPAAESCDYRCQPGSDPRTAGLANTPNCSQPERCGGNDPVGVSAARLDLVAGTGDHGGCRAPGLWFRRRRLPVDAPVRLEHRCRERLRCAGIYRHRPGALAGWRSRRAPRPAICPGSPAPGFRPAPGALPSALRLSALSAGTRGWCQAGDVVGGSGRSAPDRHRPGRSGVVARASPTGR